MKSQGRLKGLGKCGNSAYQKLTFWISGEKNSLFKKWYRHNWVAMWKDAKFDS